MDDRDWLTREKRLAYVLERWPTIAGLDPFPDAVGRESLLVMASLSVLDESGTGSMPAQSAKEIGHGVGGPVRTAIAQTDSRDDPTLERLSEDLVEIIAGQGGVDGAIIIWKWVAASRTTLSIVPPIVGLQNLVSFALYPLEHAANHGWIRDALKIRDAWIAHPEQREALDQRIRELALSLGGREHSDILDRAG